MEELPVAEARPALLEWYRATRRRLPWRGDAPPYNGSTAGVNKAGSRAAQVAAEPSPVGEVSAYGVWVSEIMCQQTRVEAVIPYWLAWMEAFPTVQDLAAASEEQVNAKWAGLGFYRRARMLHEGAKQVVDDFDGQLPQTVDNLLRLKGVGPYTAGAIASISFGVPAPIVDGNVLRVLSRLCAVASHVKQPAYADKLAWGLAARLVEGGGGGAAGELNQAVMELGATLCAPDGSGCDERDPLRALYKSTAVARDALAAQRAGDLDALLAQPNLGVHRCPVCGAGAADFLARLRAVAAGAPLRSEEDTAVAQVHALLPLPLPKKRVRQERYLVAAVRRGDAALSPGTAWLLAKRPDSGLLAGQWEFPATLLAAHKEDEPDDPGAAARATAGGTLLEQLAPGGVQKRSAVDGTLEHVFSHVRHTMHVEHACCDADAAASEWEGRTVEWMDADRMAEVGITAGVKKVIAAVSAHAQTGSAPRRAGKRRVAAGSDDGKQPKMSAFFTKRES